MSDPKPVRITHDGCTEEPMRCGTCAHWKDDSESGADLVPDIAGDWVRYDDAAAEVARLTEIVVQVDNALGNGSVESLWPPGLSRGAAVERLAEERDRYKQALERIEMLSYLEWDQAVGIACSALYPDEEPK